VSLLQFYFSTLSVDVGSHGFKLGSEYEGIHLT